MIQNTTEGLGLYALGIARPTFTNGYQFWRLFDGGEVRYWTGISPDGSSAAQVALSDAACGGPTAQDQQTDTQRFCSTLLRDTLAAYERKGLAFSDVGADRHLYSDSRLGGAIGELRRLEVGQWLLKVAATNDVALRIDHLPIGTYALYRPFVSMAVIDDRLMAYGSKEQAAVIAHELQHAADDVLGRLASQGERCLANEEDAFRTQGEIWVRLSNGTLPVAQNSVQTELNEIARLASSDPYLLIGKYISLYHDQCL